MDAQRLIDDLDDRQRAAVVSPTTPLCILAGAGSGKTRVLTRRIAYRAVTGAHDPRHVLALTFTRKAAGELAARLRQLGLRDHVAAGTFHAVAYAQLRQRWADRGVNPPQLLDRKVGFVARLLPPRQRADVLDIVTEIEWARARDLDADDYGAEAHRIGRQAPLAYREMAAVLANYAEEKRRRRLVDFDDLLALCRRDLLGDPDFARAQRWRFQHLFVDEFQDVNPLQLSLLDAWRGGRSDLCVVGDPNQAIYAWNGADPSALVDFASDHPGSEVVRLVRNYRSTPEILAVANAVLAGGELDGTTAAREATAAQLIATLPPGPAPTVSAARDDRAEATAVARAARDAHPPGARWADQAVLCRTNAQVATVEQALRAVNIPFRVRGGGSLLEQPEVKAALADMRRSDQPLTVQLADLAPTAPDAAAPPMSATADEGGEDDDNRLIDLTEGAGDRTDMGDAGETTAAGTQRSDERQANLGELARLGHDYLAVDSRPTTAGFLAWLTETTRADQPDHQGDAVDVVTFHAAKGLEWPVVHLIGLERGLVPIGHARTPEAKAEERRLFYVAITRARRELRCTWAESRDFGSSVASRSRSPYLDDVEAALAALAAGDLPADWATHLAAQRRALASPLKRPARAKASERAELDDGAQPIFDALKAWRLDRARAADVPPFVIFHDRVLIALANRRPRSRADLLDVPGIGEVKADRFGADILGILAADAPS